MKTYIKAEAEVVETDLKFETMIGIESGETDMQLSLRPDRYEDDFEAGSDGYQNKR